MAIYRVTLPVTFVIEIADSNQNAPTPPGLHGDTPIHATRRAIWWVMGQENKELRQALGVRRLMINGHEKNHESVEVADVQHPFRPAEPKEDTP